MRIDEVVNRYVGDNEVVIEGLLSKAGSFVGTKLLMKAGSELAKGLDSGITPTEMYVNMKDKKQKENFKRAIETYLGKNKHKGMEQLYSMLSK